MSAADEVLEWHDGNELVVSVTGPNGDVVAQMTLVAGPGPFDVKFVPDKNPQPVLEVKS